MCSRMEDFGQTNGLIAPGYWFKNVFGKLSWGLAGIGSYKLFQMAHNIAPLEELAQVQNVIHHLSEACLCVLMSRPQSSSEKASSWDL
jgi:hypothetical protein